MDMKWTDEAQVGAPEFENGDSAYAHYWLSLLPPAIDVRSVPSKQRSVIDQTSRLRTTTGDLIDRAFTR